MDARVAQWIEAIVDLAAAAIFAAAAGYAVARLTTSTVSPVAAGGAAFFLSLQTLRSFAAKLGGFALAPFVPSALPEPEVGELLLTDADRLDPARPEAGADELLLDDVLAELGGDSRVVRLFDASAMPTPGQLQARIDRHLNRTESQAASPDASGALHEALAELRRSLR
jgi:hypothetical protein